MPRAFYRRAYEAGEIEDEDLAAACAAAPAEWHGPRTLPELLAVLARDPSAKAKHAAVVATVAEVLDSLAAGDRNASGTAFMIDEISKWCAAYFDEGQSNWRLPGRALPPYEAWRGAMAYDRNPEVMGIARFRAIVESFSSDGVEAIGEVVRKIGIPGRALEDYLHQALLDIGGWAAYCRYRVWTNELYGREDDTLAQLLAIRIVWGYTLFAQRNDAAFRNAWQRAMEDAALPPLDERLGNDPELSADLLLAEAYEGAYRRRLFGRLAAGPSHAAPADQGAVKKLAAAFCIDVRSEIYRRALETVYPQVQTIGFAGFYGFPIEYVPIGHLRGGPQCPVLLTPTFVVCETVAGASDEEDRRILDLRLLRRRAAKAWKSFKTAAVASFIFVETSGLLFAGKILSDSLGLTRTVHDPNTDGLDSDVIDRLGPRIESRMVGGRSTGFNVEEGVRQAEAVLRAMSLTSNFARLVLLTGHGSTTVNNPHATGLDCGACGGHTGEANARVAAGVLNEPAVRAGLRERGIAVPDDTWFLGCLHDTTTDEIRIFDERSAPVSHREQIVELRDILGRATSLARRERAKLLQIPADGKTERRVVARSRDWAQVRPEWGLARNAAFIAAPRFRTRGIDLDGRVFLHDYDWRIDEGFEILELIMTAPLVVATWINLQYYGSTVNNRVFGSGNKVLHNVTGSIGVLEGNAGDLKVGLPTQSVSDGKHYVHEPLRLTTLIEAPLEALSAVIAKRTIIRELVDNSWLHLYALDDNGRVAHRYGKGGIWEPEAAGAVSSEV
jgi:uncharacterized protein YbcC (UPF0753/DUF2309 family)